MLASTKHDHSALSSCNKTNSGKMRMLRKVNGNFYRNCKLLQTIIRKFANCAEDSNRNMGWHRV